MGEIIKHGLPAGMAQIAALLINAEIQADKPPSGGQFGRSGQKNRSQSAAAWH